MNLNMSYGRERRDEEFNNLWVDPDNSYTVDVTADIPLWFKAYVEHRMFAPRQLIYR